MNIWVILLVLLLLGAFGGGWHYGVPQGLYLGGGLGLVLLIVIILMVFGR